MNILRKVGEVAGLTLISRVLGLIRDVLLFASLGTGVVNSAFIIAFTIPNLFRRLLGEGALTSSSIPVLSEVLSQEGKAMAFQLLNGILLRLLLLLGVIQCLGIAIYFGIGEISGLEERYYLGAIYGKMLFPYMIFVCLSALICGMLNVLDRFGVAALNQVWLNIAMIAAFLVGIFFVDDLEIRGDILVYSVLGGGVLQLIIPAWALRRSGWKMSLDFKRTDRVGRVIQLFIPSLLGAAIFQINILVSRMLAFSIDEASAGILYLANRLIELPLGVFAIAIGTVLFPQLSKEIALNNRMGFERFYQLGIKFIFIITVPAALGLVLLRYEIIEVLFAWGLFERSDVIATAPVLAASALGLPFFAWSTFLTRAYYAQQNMKTPVRLAGVNLLLNLALSLLLMGRYGALGLALANSISGLVHCVLLHFFLKLDRKIKLSRDTFVFVSANLIMVLVIVVTNSLTSWKIASVKGEAFIAVLVIIPISVGAYFGILLLGKYSGVKELLQRIPYRRR